MRLKSDAAIEFRFELIAKLSGEGKTQTAIAQLLQCSQAWVSKFLKRYRQAGTAAVKVRPASGGKAAYLRQEQFERLKGMLLQGALHHRFPTDNWTRERIAALIQEQFSVHYHPSHVSKLMRKLGFTLQKPRRRSFKKDQEAVRKWYQDTLPALKKKGP
ncbi:helix-turn-helix domain-containing protein [Flavisolibacter tropicus]|uniref:Winged helix-turn helix domain-containing protein n=1 Tax=Flavisolibacter tropicus TaxID=1492898 RepID=A0A172TVU9_9BACT|nr:winged helix-turn-helix domain-containing protein [Flavisolibacter tropicus]ANE51106.1 hypothetical protein SY85_11935 [Flavisolibacter tropicus]